MKNILSCRKAYIMATLAALLSIAIPSAASAQGANDDIVASTILKQGDAAPDFTVDALDGAPGVMSARYAGPGCSPDDNMTLLLHQMQGATDRRARFVTVITLILDDNVRQFTGVVEGSIAEARDGSAGFGYDPVFIAAETGQTFARMDPDAKNAISHRGRAIRQLFDYLATI